MGTFDEVLSILKDGGVVMHPTETCYGFAVDIFNKKALDKVCEIKGREENKPFSILVDSFEMAEKYGEFSELARKIARKYWPGPLSIVVPRKASLPEFLNENEKFISIRLSSHEFSSEMVSKFGGPVITTSANVSGTPPLYSVDLSQFGKKSDKIDLIIDGGDLEVNKPSTIVKVDGDKLTILREGDIKILSL